MTKLVDLRMQHSIYFNSHPHEEDDCERCQKEFEEGISTHILTKRMTIKVPGRDGNLYNFNSHPHEEDDVAEAGPEIIEMVFQLTSSRRG